MSNNHLKTSRDFLLAGCLLISLAAFSQKNEADGSRLEDSEETDYNNGWIGAGIFYNFQPFDRNFRTNGIYGQLHLNPGYFLKRDFILGLEFDGKFAKGLFLQTFTDEFKQDLSDNVYPDDPSGMDSSLVTSLSKAVNHVSQAYYCRGSYAYNLGIVFSPFPDKWGGITLLYKRGTKYFPVYTSDPALVKFEDQEWIALDVKRVNIWELRVHPTLFFRDFESMSNNIAPYMYVSVYYEGAKHSKVMLEGKDMNALYQRDFVSRNFNRSIIGFKLGIWLH